MAITDSIDVTLPDGATQYVRDLDDAIRTFKRQVEERMEDATQGLIAGDWSDTTTKELKEGIGRLFTDTRANQAALTRLVDGKVFIATDPLVTGVAFQYYNGAAWADVPLATANLMADAITTAKIANSTGAADGVTTAKLATNAVTALRANLTNVTDDTVASVTLTLIGTTSGDDFTVSFTPDSADSIIVCILQCRPSLENGAGGDTHVGIFSIEETVGATTLASTRTYRKEKIQESASDERVPLTLIGVQTGVSGARTYVAKMATSNAATTLHLEGDVVIARFMVFEFKK